MKHFRSKLRHCMRCTDANKNHFQKRFGAKKHFGAKKCCSTKKCLPSIDDAVANFAHKTEEWKSSSRRNRSGGNSSNKINNNN